MFNDVYLGVGEALEYQSQQTGQETSWQCLGRAVETQCSDLLGYLDEGSPSSLGE